MQLHPNCIRDVVCVSRTIYILQIGTEFVSRKCLGLEGQRDANQTDNADAKQHEFGFVHNRSVL